MRWPRLLGGLANLSELHYHGITERQRSSSTAQSPHHNGDSSWKYGLLHDIALKWTSQLATRASNWEAPPIKELKLQIVITCRAVRLLVRGQVQLHRLSPIFLHSCDWQIHRQIATLGYRSCLTRNGIKFAYDFDTDESTWFKQGNEDSWEALILQQNRTVILHTKYREIVGRQSNIQFSDSSQQDDQLVSHAVRLVRKVRTMATERENGGWKRFIEIELFHHYDYFDIFSSRYVPLSQIIFYLTYKSGCSMVIWPVARSIGSSAISQPQAWLCIWSQSGRRFWSTWYSSTSSRVDLSTRVSFLHTFWSSGNSFSISHIGI